jgi:hypothetical protein
MRSQIGAVPKMPGRVPERVEEQMLTLLGECLLDGPERTEAELGSVGHSGI